MIFVWCGKNENVPIWLAFASFFNQIFFKPTIICHWFMLVFCLLLKNANYLLSHLMLSFFKYGRFFFNLSFQLFWDLSSLTISIQYLVLLVFICCAFRIFYPLLLISLLFFQLGYQLLISISIAFLSLLYEPLLSFSHFLGTLPLFVTLEDLLFLFEFALSFQ